MSEIDRIVSSLSSIERDILAGGPRQYERRWLDALCEKGLMKKLSGDVSEILGYEYQPTDLGRQVTRVLGAEP